jgi:hypothetical protein
LSDTDSPRPRGGRWSRAKREPVLVIATEPPTPPAAEPPSVVMRRLTDSPDYLAANNNVAALEERARGLEQQLADALKAEGPLPADTGALALVVGGTGLRPQVDYLDKDIVGRGAVANISRELATVRRATELQRLRLTQLRTEVSRQIIAQALPEYHRAVARVAAAARELLAASRIEVSIRQPLYGSDVALGEMFPMPVPDVVVERLEHYLDEAESSGK